METLFSENQWHVWLPLGVLGVAAIVLLLRVLERGRKTRLEQVVEAQLAPRLLPGYDQRVRRPLFWLTVIGFAALFLALAQPRWGQAWVEIEKRTRDIIILFDTSESMNAANPKPSRLIRAKQKVESLLDLCPGDRFGLIAFSGGAALQCPLTLDHAYFRSVLGAVDTDTLSAEGTDIEAALKEAKNVFEEDAERSSDAAKASRAIILISDGEQVTGDAVKAAQSLSEIADIFVLAAGSLDGATVMPPSWNQGARVAEDVKSPHVSKLDETTLRSVARNADAFLPLMPSNEDVERLANQLEQLTSRTMASEVRNRLINRYQWPLGLAIICFAAEGFWLAAMPSIRRWRMHRDSDGGEAEAHA